MALRGARAIVLLTMVVFGGCTSIDVEQLPSAQGLALVDKDGLVPDQQYRIRPGDDLDIKFFYTQELNDSAVVRPDGYISLQLVDEVKVAGMTPQQVDDLLTEKYAKHIKEPAISVIVRSFKGFRAYVGGEVAIPQVVSLESGMSVMQAIYRVGGTLPTANLQSVVLIRKGSKGEPIPYHLDLSDDAITEGRPDLHVALTPSDIIYIPRTPIANANKWVQQYITDLVLFKGVQLGFGVNYNIDRDGDGDN